jgi:hypothetical protein
MAFAKPWPVRVAAGHFRTAISIAAGVLAYLLPPDELGVTTRSVVAWDLGDADGNPRASGCGQNLCGQHFGFVALLRSSRDQL